MTAVGERVGGWRFRLARHAYSGLLFALIPLIFLYFLWRSRREPAYRDALGERFRRQSLAPQSADGLVLGTTAGATVGTTSGPAERSISGSAVGSTRGSGAERIRACPVLWIHAASLGEMRIAGTLARALVKQFPKVQLLITTLTPAGRSEAEALRRANLPVTLRYLPLDLPHLMHAWVRSVRPDLVVLIETELWPNLLWQCRRAEVPVALVNARLSPQRRATYLRLGALYGPLVAGLAGVAAQSGRDAAALRALGAQDVTVTGNIKFDTTAVPVAPVIPRSRFAGDWLWLAGSTHPGEEVEVLRVHQRLSRRHPRRRLQMILAPRHPGRAAQLQQLATELGLTAVLRSNLPDTGLITADILILDSFGELTGLYQLTDAAFIGGSLVPHGGQNPLEAVAAGCPVLLGPHTAHFADMVAGLIANQGVWQVRDGDGLEFALGSLLQNPRQGQEMAERAATVLAEGRGGTERTVQLLRRWLSAQP